MVAAFMAVPTVRAPVVGVVPGAVPLTLTSNAFQVPVTLESVNVLLDTSCKFKELVLAPVVFNVSPVAPAFPFSMISA